MASVAPTDPRLVELHRKRNDAQATVLAAERAIREINERETADAALDRLEAQARLRRRDFGTEQ